MASRRQTSDALVKAAIYARVSSDDGRQSTANQLQQLRELASVSPVGDRPGASEKELDQLYTPELADLVCAFGLTIRTAL
jgi:predicted site-specific integrase-resolvase